MNWKTLVALPLVGLMVYVVMAAVSFGDRVGSTWSDATTATVTNGLVMVCFGGTLFGVFLISVIIAVALASRLIPQQGAQRPYMPPPERDMGRRIPAGWGDDVVDGEARRGRVVSIEPPAGMRPMLPETSGGLMLPSVPMPSGAFDAMEDTADRRYRLE